MNPHTDMKGDAPVDYPQLVREAYSFAYHKAGCNMMRRKNGKCSCGYHKLKEKLEGMKLTYESDETGNFMIGAMPR